MDYWAKPQSNGTYQLQKRGKTLCPKCQKKTFVLYQNTLDGKVLSDKVGKCDRADKCGYHFPPREWFKSNDKPLIDIAVDWTAPLPPQEVSHIDPMLLDATLKAYECNTLARYLASIWGWDSVIKVLKAYKCGTMRSGAIIYWQVDADGKVRTGKAMQYLADGHRDKAHFGTWMHKKVSDDTFNLEQCLFGEHLLSDKPIYIVESEKSALICTLSGYDVGEPCVWMASGGSEGLNVKKFKRLAGRKIVLVPDVGMEEKWERRAQELTAFGYNVSVRNLCEGMPISADIADVITLNLNTKINENQRVINKERCR